MRALMFVSRDARSEAVLPEITLWESAFEWPWSVVLQDIGTVLMASRFAGNEPTRWRFTEGIV